MNTEEYGNILERLNRLISESDFKLVANNAGAISLELPDNIEDILRHSNNDIEASWSIYFGCIPVEHAENIPAIKEAFITELAAYLDFS